MSIMTALSRFFGAAPTTLNGSAFPYRAQTMARITPAELPQRALYDLLRSAYYSNGMYDDLRGGWSALGYVSPSIKAIRNVVPPVVNTLGGKLFPEPLQVTTPLTAGITSQEERAALEARDPIKAAIEQVWDWSNWARGKRTFARQVALFGECYIKCIVAPERGRVFFEIVSPELVTDFEVDERDYLTSIRIDVPQCDETSQTRRYWTHTEAWHKETLTYQRWETDGDASQRRLEDLGTPVEVIDIRSFGIDFLPFSRAVFSGIGDKRAIGAVQLAVEAIIEADLSSTNLHQAVFQDLEGAWVLKAVGLDANNRPLPPPVVGPATTDGLNGRQSDNSVQVGKRSFWRLGGNQELQSVIPNIDYAGALAILKDHDEHLEKLMPALSYCRLSELSGGDLSGKAITYKMRAFVDQVEEGRSNVLASLRQADMMALTMGQAAGIDIFQGIGSFEAGDFEHDFEEQPILHISSLDEAEEKRTLAQAAQALSTAGIPMSVILTDTLGMGEQEATEVVDAATAEAEQAFQQQQDLAAATAAPAQDNSGGQFGNG